MKRRPSPLEKDAVDVGLMLRQYFKKHRIRKSALSRLMQIHLNTLLLNLKHPSIRTHNLWALSHALKHNFFRDLADQLPEHYTISQPKDTRLEEEIAALQERIKLLEAEKGVLIEVMKKN